MDTVLLWMDRFHSIIHMCVVWCSVIIFSNTTFNTTTLYDDDDHFFLLSPHSLFSWSFSERKLKKVHSVVLVIFLFIHTHKLVIAYVPYCIHWFDTFFLYINDEKGKDSSWFTADKFNPRQPPLLSIYFFVFYERIFSFPHFLFLRIIILFSPRLFSASKHKMSCVRIMSSAFQVFSKAI